MIKRLTALLLSICLILSAVPAYAGAATGQRVYADAVTVTAGNNAFVTLTAENFENIAALDIYIYYDAAVFTVGGTYNGYMLDGAQTSVNTGEAGTIKLSAMALNGISGTGHLLTVYFQTKYNCTPGVYPIAVAVGRAYDTDLAEATISSANGSVTVEKRVVTETFEINNYANRYTLRKGDLLDYYVEKTWEDAFVSGEFLVEYDHELFAFDSVTLSSAMTQTGAIYSVNSAVLGQVRIAYAGNASVYDCNLFSVSLRTIADADAETSIRTTVSNVYREDLTAYLPSSTSLSVQLNKTPQVIDYPNAFLKTEMLVAGKQSKSVFYLEEGAGVAAGDFSITYDPEVLRCVGVNVTKEPDEKGGMVITNDNFSAGTIRFSYVNMQASEEALSLVEILWEPVQAPTVHTMIGLDGRGVVDTEQTAIQLEYINDINCIYAITRTEPTCQKEGKVEYLCPACQNLQVQTIPMIPEADCTHYTVLFVDADGTELLRQVCHYGDEITIPADPVKPEDDSYTYTFAGWDKEVVNCVGDAVYTATYTSTYIDYTVTFVDEDGTELSGKTYHWGDAVTAPADPTKAADNTYTYAFAGWDKPVVNCAGDAVYTATYTSTYIDYTVIFVDEDGTELSRQICHYGDTVVVPQAPVKEEDETYTYTFAGWDKEIVNCAGDAVYTATYTSVKKPVVFVGEQGYGTLAEAVENASAGSILRLIRHTEEDVTVTKDLILDLDGFDFKGNITVASGTQFFIKDSQTDDYTIEDEAGYGKLTGTVTGVQAAEGYMMITEEDGVSFHRVDLEIHTMTLRPSEVGVYYQSNFAGDELVAQNVACYGVALSVQGEPTENAPGILSWFEDFQTGSNEANGTLLHGIMKPTNTESENAVNAELPVYGRAYILTQDGQYIFGQSVSRSLRQQVEAIDSRWNTLTAQQQTELLEMYALYRSVMDNWNIPNIKSK